MHLKWKESVGFPLVMRMSVTLTVWDDAADAERWSALPPSAAAHVWSGWRGRQRLETTHYLQERLLPQPPCHTVVLEGKHIKIWTHTEKHIRNMYSLNSQPSVAACQSVMDAASLILKVPDSFPFIRPAAGLLASLLKIKVCLDRTNLFALMKEPGVVFTCPGYHLSLPQLLHTRTRTHTVCILILSVIQLWW